MSDSSRDKAVIPDPSLSRNIRGGAYPPTLHHTLHQEESSVLSVAADKRHIFSGSQGYDIYVWDRHTFNVETTLRGHTGSVLALEIAPDRCWLFSSSGDSTVRIWCTKNLVPLYILNPYMDTDSGDIYSLSWSPALQTIYFGCQNTSLQWFDFHDMDSSGCFTRSHGPSSSTDSLPSTISESKRMAAKHKFFNGNGRSGQATPPRPPMNDVPQPKAVLQVEGANVIASEHYGYIYSMAILPCPHEGADHTRETDDVLLVTGSGDETVKLWQCDERGPILLHTFSGCDGAVLSLIARHETVYAGCQDGVVKIWDLETRTLVRSIIAQEGIDILSMSMLDTDLYTCSANGQIQRWSASFDCTASWNSHDGIVLSSVITHHHDSDKWWLVSGASDNTMKLWTIERPRSARGISLSPVARHFQAVEESPNMDDTMLYALSKFVSIPSVSSSQSHREDCRQAAIWLRKCLTQLGAEASLLPTALGTNPLVLGTFTGTQSLHKKRPRLLFYGHYDVISAPHDGWHSDPFTLTGKNGYVYGRGATDNKGPILAVACAASELLSRRQLECDLVLLVEGEEEVGSAGFAEAIGKHLPLIGHIDAILVSNSTWISEDKPCITYGLRGVVHSHVEITSQNPDLHSGLDGGAVAEPMQDLVGLLSTLSEGGNVKISGFYDKVRPQTEEEEDTYKILSAVTQQSPSLICSRWREPTLSIHSIQVSGPGNSTVIPSSVKAKVSMRIVPDQDLDTIAKTYQQHLYAEFEKMHSPNKLKVHIDHTADWWLGNLSNPWYKALEAAVHDEWGVSPLRIREGGSVPSVPFLEKAFKCPALHLPLGQSSDQAHLPNERISLANLRRGKSVIQRFLQKISLPVDQ